MAKVDGASFELDGEVFRYLVIGTTIADTPSLTPAEREVVAMVCDGCTNGEVAKTRGTSVHTVGNQLAAVFHKVGVKRAMRFDPLATIEKGYEPQADVTAWLHALAPVVVPRSSPEWDGRGQLSGDRWR